MLHAAPALLLSASPRCIFVISLFFPFFFLHFLRVFLAVDWCVSCRLVLPNGLAAAFALTYNREIIADIRTPWLQVLQLQLHLKPGRGDAPFAGCRCSLLSLAGNSLILAGQLPGSMIGLTSLFASCKGWAVFCCCIEGAFFQ